MTDVWTTASIPAQSGKTYIVTGANSGIGYEAALELAKKGASVVLACRSPERSQAAADRIRAAAPKANLELAPLDLASLRSVRSFADWFQRTHDRLDVLINNAGVMAIPRQVTEDGFEMQLATNHLGHFALTGLLLGRLLASAPSRVVNVSSMVHVMGKFDWDDLQMERRYDKWLSYARSKMANLLFTYELARRLQARGAGVIAVACHPGYAATNLQSVGPRLSGSALGKAFMAVGNAVFAQSAAAGAWPTLLAATGPDVRGGDFYGPAGPMHMTGVPKKHASHRRSYDKGDAARLWDASVKLTGVTFAELPAAAADGVVGQVA
jgi:NAD(P)-dependent dehydrogenase (short-subunit alcohol dehydrogenase family)